MMPTPTQRIAELEAENQRLREALRMAQETIRELSSTIAELTGKELGKL